MSLPRRRPSLFAALGKLLPGHGGNNDEPGQTNSTPPAYSTNIPGLSQIPSHITAATATSTSQKQPPDLNTLEKDLLFRYQLAEPEPRRLGREAFHHGGVCVNARISARIHESLQKQSIISTHAEDYALYTDRITRKLPHELSFVDHSSLQKLVCMLFWWEQEISRWTLISTQIEAQKRAFERDQKTIEEGREERREELMVLLEMHRMKVAQMEAAKKMLPSVRDMVAATSDEDTERRNEHMRPPAYGDTLSTIAVLSSPSRENFGAVFGRAPGAVRTNAPTEDVDPMQASANASTTAGEGKVENQL